MKLNLGAGYKHIDGYKSVDFRKVTKPDYLINLENERCLKRFKTNSIEEIYTSSTLEHIKNIQELMSEIYRVCKPNAKVIICVPHWGNQSSVEDPTHVRYFTENSMNYFDKDLVGSDSHLITIPYDFKIEGLVLNPKPEYKGLNAEQLIKKSHKYLNVINKMVFTLRVNK